MTHHSLRVLASSAMQNTSRALETRTPTNYHSHNTPLVVPENNISWVRVGGPGFQLHVISKFHLFVSVFVTFCPDSLDNEIVNSVKYPEFSLYFRD